MESAPVEDGKNDHEYFQNYAEVGIEWYLNDNKPILNGVVKHRYSDFVVNEIDPEGNIATLERDTDIVKEINAIENSGKKQEEIKEIAEQGPKKIVVSQEAKTIITSLLKEDGEKLLEFIRRINEGLCERTEQLALGNLS